VQNTSHALFSPQLLDGALASLDLLDVVERYELNQNELEYLGAYKTVGVRSLHPCTLHLRASAPLYLCVSAPASGWLADAGL
jgi:hypothetical protein